jgi:hypothetical protein
MRVVRTFVILLITLLWLCLFTPVAGAIYIEGQQTPNDGLPHILAAGDDKSPVTGMVSSPFSGMAGLWNGFPTMPGTGSPLTIMPGVNDDVGFDTGSVIGHKVSSPSTRSRTMFDPAYVRTNMPLLSGRFFR